jgi:hypothetical protein
MRNEMADVFTLTDGQSKQNLQVLFTPAAGVDGHTN